MNPVLREMNMADLDAIMLIEQEVHAHPWTRGNFADSLKSDCVCKVYEENEVLGYAVFLRAVDEAQLLDIGIAAAHQRKGLGRRLLEEMMEIARSMGLLHMLLEVRPSNVAALELYRSTGFRTVGTRRGYYPSENGREDALVMECEL